MGGRGEVIPPLPPPLLVIRKSRRDVPVRTRRREAHIQVRRAAYPAIGRAPAALRDRRNAVVKPTAITFVRAFRATHYSRETTVLTCLLNGGNVPAGSAGRSGHF